MKADLILCFGDLVGEYDPTTKRIKIKYRYLDEVGGMCEPMGSCYGKGFSVEHVKSMGKTFKLTGCVSGKEMLQRSHEV